VIQWDDQAMFGAPFFCKYLFLKTPLLAAEGFVILGIQIQAQKNQLNHYVILANLTGWGGYPDLMGAYA
jgi:hypothetical protein